MAKRKYSRNPDDWYFLCTEDGCENIVRYDKYGTYRHVCFRVENGGGCRCKQCDVKNRTVTRNPPPRIYSRKPEDWKFSCSGCGKELIYTSQQTYQAAFNKKKRRGELKCNVCCQLGRTLCEESLKSFREKRSTTIKNWSDSQWVAYYKNLSDGQIERWVNATEEEWSAKSKSTTEMHRRRTPEQKLEIYRKIGAARRNLFKTAEKRGSFRSAYNKKTIELIVDVLNVKYETEFRHGGSENGEFKVYDHQLKSLYFADAYCPMKNIWVEFDERHHFVAGELKPACQQREHRIREILDCMFLRIKTNHLK